MFRPSMASDAPESLIFNTLVTDLVYLKLRKNVGRVSVLGFGFLRRSTTSIPGGVLTPHLRPAGDAVAGHQANAECDIIILKGH